MRVRLPRLFGVVLLIVCIGAPMAEIFDGWDQTVQDGNDTEANLIIVVLCVGIGVVGAAAFLRRVRPSLTATLIRWAQWLPLALTDLRNVLPFFDASSPPSLRI